MKKMLSKKNFCLLSIIVILLTLTIFFLCGKKINILSNKVSNIKYNEDLELDNWEISTVFYDSTVNNGNTPLTEINWDASDGGYGQGESRIITVQINYKNTNCTNDYDVGDLIITIPWLTSSEANLNIVSIVGANDESHTGYDWNVEYDTNNKELTFSNNQVINKNTNFEGSIQMLYEMTPKSESPEVGIDSCLHELKMNLQAMIHYNVPNEEWTINQSGRDTTFEFENDEYDYYVLNMGYVSITDINFYLIAESPTEIIDIRCPKNNNCSLSSKKYTLTDGIYLHISDYENVNNKTLSFSGTIKAYKSLATSNIIKFNYERTYTHNWTKYDYQMTKKASQVTTLDGLENANDYIWVKYTFSIPDCSYQNYYDLTLFTRSKDYMWIYDDLPSNVIVYQSGTKIEPYEGTTYRFGIYIDRTNVAGNYYIRDRVYEIIVGYPKSEYNSNYNNMIVTNSANLYLKHHLATDEDEYEYEDTANTTIDLNDFVSVDYGSLYSFDKKKSSNTISSGTSVCGNCYTTHYTQAINGSDPSLDFNSSLFAYEIQSSAKYIGNPLTIKVGDDYLVAKNINNEYEKINDNDYHMHSIKIKSIKNIYGKSIINKYNWKLFVRKANNTEYEFYSNITEVGNITFADTERIIDYYIYGEDIEDSINITHYPYYIFHKSDIPETGNLYNFAFSAIYYKNNNNLILQNVSDETSYDSFVSKEEIKQHDIATFGNYVQRSKAIDTWSPYVVKQPITKLVGKKEITNSLLSQDDENNEFHGEYTIGGVINSGEGYYYNSNHQNDYDDKYRISGFEIYDLLPEGMILNSTKEEILNSISAYVNNITTILDDNFEVVDNNSFLNEYIKRNMSEDDIVITNNWEGTNRTRIKISVNFGKKVFIFTKSSNNISLNVLFHYNFSIPYDYYTEFGDTYRNYVYVENHENEISQNGNTNTEELDINENGNLDSLPAAYSDARISSVTSTNQDLVVFVKSNDSNYLSQKVIADYSNIYDYKLRVRTGQNSIKNLVIYDSIEEYAKDSNQNFALASGIKPKWQGEFLGIDTSYAEEKGYNVKVYYSNNNQPGNLNEDNSWQEYNDNVDKSQVKSLAFQYLDENNQPAILPANSLTYVIIRMKAPSNHYKTFAYNGCWTEWNSIDPVTNEPIDFVTGINSNIVKVGLPSSVEPEDMELTLTKKWQDNSNSLSKRPENVTFSIIANNDYSNATDITFSGTGNTWTKIIDVPKYDNNGEEISYTIREETINLENNYKYIPSVDNYEVTNTLYKNIIITKNWIDNNNSYLTRPSNITVKVYQNNNYYKNLNITGDYNTNTWTGSLSVPAFDNNGNEYNYTVDEISVNNYSTTCENLVCTNTLTGEENLTISKIWNDNNNQYNTRPASISIKLKQNGSDYQNINLNGDSNTWNSSTITVPKYDSNGVKYNYTIEETPAEHYGLVEYNQDSYTVSNSLKENVNLTITKKWLDNDNEYNTRPQELKITLLQNNNEYQEITLTGDSNTWSTTIEVPKYDNNQKLYKYTIKEVTDNLEDYQDISYSEEELEVINKLKKNDKLLLTKRWLDHDNEYKTRPEKITIQLLQNGEVYQEVELSGDSNTWEKEIEIPVYDDNSTRYIYTIKELEPIDKYEKITIDQTTLTITNELTEVPTVTVYFTVLNGYILPGTNEIRYDEEGFREMLRQHNIDPDQEYAFTFLLENIETNKTYEGRLSTKGVLEFEGIPYGDYKAIEGEDDIFEFVSMESISNVMGVTFTPSANGGIISIRPTGQNIIYGANIINKIAAPIPNPNTKSGIKILIIILMITGIMTLLLHFNKFPKKITS